MAVQLLQQEPFTPLARLVEDYLISCQARGLSPRTDEQYGYALRSVFLRWCGDEGVTRLDQLDRRTFDRFTSWLLHQARALGLHPADALSVVESWLDQCVWNAKTDDFDFSAVTTDAGR